MEMQDASNGDDVGTGVPQDKGTPAGGVGAHIKHGKHGHHPIAVLRLTASPS